MNAPTAEITQPARHISMGAVTSKQPWDGKPGVRKQKTPRVFTYHGKMENDLHIMKVILKMAAAGSVELRRQEIRTKSFYKSVTLRKARVTDMRWRSRVTYLAYAFLRGKTYRSCENSTTGFKSKAEFENICYQAHIDVTSYGGEKHAKTTEGEIQDWVLAGFDSQPWPDEDKQSSVEAE